MEDTDEIAEDTEDSKDKLEDEVGENKSEDNQIQILLYEIV